MPLADTTRRSGKQKLCVRRFKPGVRRHFEKHSSQRGGWGGGEGGGATMEGMGGHGVGRRTLVGWGSLLMLLLGNPLLSSCQACGSHASTLPLYCHGAVPTEQH